MKMKLKVRTIVTWCSLIAAGFLVDGWYSGGIVTGDAEARIGRPATPGSVAGTARRTTRRTIRRSTTYIAALPGNCKTVNIDGTVLSQCGGTYYQPHNGQYVVVYVD